MEKFKNWLNEQNWDLVYKIYLENYSSTTILKLINAPYKKFDPIREILKEKGYKMKTTYEATSQRNKMTIWNDDKKLKHSKAMHNAVINNPEKYLGRYRGRKMKTFEDFDFKGNKCTHLGTWEKLVADLLTENKVNWFKEPHSFEYEFNNSKHLYYPDFYLPEYDSYIEVKGFETEMDRAKWKNFPKKLFIIKGDKLINQLKTKKINIIDLLKSKP